MGPPELNTMAKAAKKDSSKKKTPAKKGITKEKKPRAPSAYNVFMKKEIEKLKKSHPNLDHKERFNGRWQLVQAEEVRRRVPAGTNHALRRTCLNSEQYEWCVFVTNILMHL